MPLLSVVVPYYQVEDYIEDCIASLRAQTLSDLEIIMIDDGSRDGSAAIAHRHAEDDTRLRVIAQPNQGLGPARNTGLAASSGKYVTFVDSDDILSANALELLVGSLEESGSEQASCNARRFDPLRVWPSYLHSRITNTIGRRSGTHIYHHPVLALDRMAWNKVYRRSLLDRLEVQFPAIRYEDYPVTLACHLAARSVDWVAVPGYYWRVRHSGTSITQAARELDNLRDRITSASMVNDVLQGQPDLVGREVRRHLGEIDIPVLLEVAAHSPGARDQVDALAAAMLAVVTPEVLAILPSPIRAKFSALLRGDWDRFLALSAEEAAGPRSREVRVPGTTYKITKTPAWDRLGRAVRDGGVRVTRIRPTSPALVGGVSRSQDGGVRLEGQMHRVCAPQTDGRFSFHAVHVYRGLDMELGARFMDHPDRPGARFEVAVPRDVLARALPRVRGDTSAIRFETRTSNRSRRDQTAPLRGAPGATSPSSLGEVVSARAAEAWLLPGADPETWIQPRLGRDSAMEIGMLSPAVRTRSIRLRGASVVIEIDPEPSLRDVEVLLVLSRDGGRPERHPMSLRDDGAWDLAIPTALLASGHPHDPMRQESRWRVEVECAHRRYPLMPRSADLGQTDEGNLTFSLEPDGPFLNALVLSRTQPDLGSITADDRTLWLAGVCNGLPAPEMLLIGSDDPSRHLPLDVTSDFSTWQSSVHTGQFAAPGKWVLCWDAPGAGPVPLRVGRGEGRPPAALDAPHRRWALHDDGGRLTVEILSTPHGQPTEASVP